ncbi:MAG: hypothetical protein ACE5IJ_09410, partial [Thermoplasmata archaeon]
CRNVHTVRRRGKRILVSGARVQLFYCNACQRTFDRATASIPLPACSRCGRRRAVQYFREWSSRSGVRFRVFGCRACRSRFRVVVPKREVI